MSREWKALAVGRDGVSRFVRLVTGERTMVPAGKAIWAAEPGRGSDVGRIALETMAGDSRYLVRIDGEVVCRPRSLERALARARRFEADPESAVRARDRARARSVTVMAEWP